MVSHPGIVQLLETIKDDGKYYLVLEDLGGVVPIALRPLREDLHEVPLEERRGKGLNALLGLEVLGPGGAIGGSVGGVGARAVDGVGVCDAIAAVYAAVADVAVRAVFVDVPSAEIGRAHV